MKPAGAPCRLDGPPVCRERCPCFCRCCGHCGAGHCAPLPKQGTGPCRCGAGRVRPLCRAHPLRPLGRCHDLARALAAVCGAVPVITTATDANGVFAVDEWAKHQNCTVLEPERIKLVSGALLAGKTVQFASDWPIAGAPPDGITAGDDPDFALTLCPAGDALHLVPRIGVLGVGCNAAPAPKRWPKPLQLSVTRTALRRNASRRRQAST